MKRFINPLFQSVSWISEPASAFHPCEIRPQSSIPAARFLPAKSLRDEVGIGHDHRQRIAGRHEELRATNHVAICIAIRCSTEAWDGFAGLDLVPLLTSNGFKRDLFKAKLSWS